jgi:3-oxoacyl-[acyl-carrier-protein] synthase II
VDSVILSGLPKASEPAAFLNERLMNDLRPTLFLAQLSNLLAGNISIVHGVTGSSRTFMGEEAAGVDAVRIAHARIAAGQSDVALVGGAHNGERKDLLMLYEFGGLNLKDTFAPVWERSARPGFALGSLGAFLVIESRRHAEQRGATPIARLSAVASDRSRRKPDAVTDSLRRLLAKIAPTADERDTAVISGATGVEPATSEERAFLAEHPGLAVRATTTQIGHGFEPQFLMNVALAAMAVQRGALFAPGDAPFEQPMPGPLRRAIVTAVGHWRGEGMALVEAL